MLGHSVSLTPSFDGRSVSGAESGADPAPIPLSRYVHHGEPRTQRLHWRLQNSNDGSKSLMQKGIVWVLVGIQRTVEELIW